MMRLVFLCLTVSTSAAFLFPPPPINNRVLLSMAASSQESAAESDDLIEQSDDENTGDAIGTSLSSTSPRVSNAIVMSQAIPFLPCPKVLQANADMAGNFGFDPLNLSKNTEQLMEYREAEIKHSRLAMLAAVGWPASELWDRAVANVFGMDPMLDEVGRAPSLLNGGLARVSPIWWGFCLGLSAAIDLYGVAKARRGDPEYRPGMLGFDPFGFYPADKPGQQRMELAEIKHGRLAMVTVVSYVAEEWATKMALVNETPEFFKSLLSATEHVENTMV